MAGVTLSQAGVILGHGAGMALGGFYGTDHGATVGLLLPALLEYTLPESAGRLAKLARHTGVAAEATEDWTNRDELTDLETAEQFIQRIRELVGRLANRGLLPRSLAEWGCDLEELPHLTDFVLDQGATHNHPVSLGKAEVEAFLHGVLS